MKRFGYDFEKKVIKVEAELASLREREEADEDVLSEIRELEKKLNKLMKETYGNLSAWQRVLLSRHPLRPRSRDYILEVFDRFREIHGSRKFEDDPAVITGIGEIENGKVAVCAVDKGKDAKENVEKNFGMINPEGYYQCIRLMKLAQRFNLPVVTLVDTPGAYPGIKAEERGQAWAIAESIKTLLWLKVPTVSIITGEGGSGGALALASVDRLLMMENSYFSVISPEGCASILWKDEKKASEAAKNLKITAKDLQKLGIVHEIIEEPLGGAHRNKQVVFKNVKETLVRNLNLLKKQKSSELLKRRHNYFMNIGNNL